MSVVLYTRILVYTSSAVPETSTNFFPAGGGVKEGRRGQGKTEKPFVP